jgi:hypothetical protein
VVDVVAVVVVVAAAAVVDAVVVAVAVAVVAVGSGLRVDLIARFVGLPLMFFYARIARIASVSWVAPVLVAGFHLPHNLNIANIQT